MVNTSGTNIYTDQSNFGTGYNLYAGGPNNPQDVSGGGLNFTDSSPSLEALPGASMALRNATLAGLYKKLKGPSLSNLYESGLVDKAAQGLKQGKQTQAETLSSRGLYNSGARAISDRGLRNAYTEQVTGAVGTAAGADIQRKQSLLDAIQAINEGDVNFLQALTSGSLGTRGADIGAEQLGQLRNENLAKGAASIVATIAGGVAGAAGSGAGGASGGTGAAIGAYNAAQASQSIGGGNSLYSMDSRYGGGGSPTPQFGYHSNIDGYGLTDLPQLTNYAPWNTELSYGGYGGGQ